MDDEYGRASGDQAKENIVDMGVFILPSFLAGLRGKEALKLVLGETRDYLYESENYRVYKHVFLPLRGGLRRKVVNTFISLWLLQERIQDFVLNLGLEGL